MSAVDNYVDIMFGEFRPDLGGMPNPDMPGYLVDAAGVRLTPNGYRGTPAFADVTSAAVIGGNNAIFIPACYKSSAGSIKFFVMHQADAKIYASDDEGQTWNDATPAAGAALDVPGNFFTYENDVMYVCANRAAIRRSLAAVGGTDFSDLGGSPPIARCGAQVRQHAVLGGIITGALYHAVQWSAIGDHQDWPTPGSADALSKESGLEKLPQDLGFVRAVLGGEKIGIVVQEYGLTRMTYEGGDTVYAFDTYETQVGYGKNRTSKFVSDGTLWYWYNDTGFYATDGYSVNRLDDGKIEDAIFTRLLSYDTNKTLPTSDGQSAYDSHRHLCIFGNHLSNYQLTYDPRGSFTFMNETTVSSPFVGESSSAASSKTYGRAVYNINDSSRKLQILSADGATVAMQTGYIELEPGRRVQVQGAHLLGVGVPGSLTLAYKTAASYAAMDLALTGFTNLTAPTRGMKSTAHDDSQFYAFRITGTGSEAQLIRGIRVYFTDAGPST